MNSLFLKFVKGIFLLIGIAMLIGGGLCSAAIPYMAMNIHKIPPFIFLVFIATVLLSPLYFWARISSFSQQVKILALLISTLFLVGGGLCAAIPKTPKLGFYPGFAGLLLIDIAITLCGYLLIRWILASKNKSQ